MLKISLNYGDALFYKALKKKQNVTSEETLIHVIAFPCFPVRYLTYRAPASVFFNFLSDLNVARVKKLT